MTTVPKLIHSIAARERSDLDLIIEGRLFYEIQFSFIAIRPKRSRI
jgi:hypothetical protein